MSSGSGPDVVVSAIECVEGHGRPRGKECHYRIAWSINPHMRVGAASPMRARAQLGRFAHELRVAGARLIEVPFVHGAYDSVFAKDSALLTVRNGERRALLAHPRCHQRRVEQRARRQMLAAQGFAVADAPGPFFEGGDVVVAPGVRELFLGHGFRSERRAARALERHAECPVRPLRLRHPLLYHLDMALALLSDGTALVCREAFDAASLASLEASAAIRRLVCVPLAEALSFALNLVEIGDRVLADGDSPTVATALEASGRSLRRVDLSEFRLAGGSAACLCAIVHQPRAAAAQPIDQATSLSA